MSEIRFDGRVAVITGAGGGLGRAYALLLASRGAKVVVNDLGGTFDGVGSDTAAAQKVVDEIKALGGEAVANFDSVSQWESAVKIIQTAVDHYGKIDILINNAGILRDKSLMKMEIEDYLKVMAVHLNGTFFCTKAAFAEMRKQNYGRIVSTASAAGVYGNFGQTNYGAAKMGIVGLMNCVKQEGARYGILANTIVPTAGTRLTATVMPPDVVEKVKPEYVAPLVAWLCSEQCDVSGNIFTAGGGYFSRAAVVEGPGVFFDPSREITVEMVVEKLDQIKSLEGGREFGSALEQTGYALSKLVSI
ncbi:MAG TPA: SDR family oxidoreductase [Bacillota bacterium]|jgi:NAD(P)-dependent dehydrogenase (short-subunit alcohol dehydrogenase family)|nr:SDR family oxidoreductase [Bacillota bacterium]HOB86594.1 SDR family oxidoreductase [Bacillota bacterium]HOP69845.1 SDR family oxidoreductase [Bacillota bacterium]HPT34765.1 SDR family oxidoreductase [Bacillota bacterium]HPZ65383.1 SDR family oxidoreductase [Bacillota bacterium]